MAQYCTWIADYDPTNEAQLHIVKVHNPEDAHSLRPTATVTAFRDLRAVISSLCRMGWCTGDLVEIGYILDTYINIFAVWQKQACVVTDYRQMAADPEGCIATIAQALGLECSAALAAEIRTEIDRTFVERSRLDHGDLRYDPVTLLHQGHIGDVADDAAIERLDGAILDYIETKYGHWLTDHGFDLRSRDVASQVSSDRAVP